MHTESSTRYLRAGECATRAIGGQTLVVPIRHGVGDLESIYTLNPVAAFLWDALKAGATEAQLVDAVTAEYEVTRDQAARDVSEFLAWLLDERLVELVPAERDAA